MDADGLGAAEQRPDVLGILERVEHEDERRFATLGGPGEDLLEGGVAARPTTSATPWWPSKPAMRRQGPALDLDDRDPQARRVEDDPLEGGPALRRDEEAARLAAGDEGLFDRPPSGDDLLAERERLDGREGGGAGRSGAVRRWAAVARSRRPDGSSVRVWRPAAGIRPRASRPIRSRVLSGARPVLLPGAIGRRATIVPIPRSIPGRAGRVTGPRRVAGARPIARRRTVTRSAPRVGAPGSVGRAAVGRWSASIGRAASAGCRRRRSPVGPVGRGAGPAGLGRTVVRPRSVLRPVVGARPAAVLWSARSGGRPRSGGRGGVHGRRSGGRSGPGRSPPPAAVAIRQAGARRSGRPLPARRPGPPACPRGPRPAPWKSRGDRSGRPSRVERARAAACRSTSVGGRSASRRLMVGRRPASRLRVAVGRPAAVDVAAGLDFDLVAAARSSPTWPCGRGLAADWALSPRRGRRLAWTHPAWSPSLSPCPRGLAWSPWPRRLRRRRLRASRFAAGLRAAGVARRLLLVRHGSGPRPGASAGRRVCPRRRCRGRAARRAIGPTRPNRERPGRSARASMRVTSSASSSDSGDAVIPSTVSRSAMSASPRSASAVERLRASIRRFSSRMSSNRAARAGETLRSSSIAASKSARAPSRTPSSEASSATSLR